MVLNFLVNFELLNSVAQMSLNCYEPWRIVIEVINEQLMKQFMNNLLSNSWIIYEVIHE